MINIMSSMLTFVDITMPAAMDNLCKESCKETASLPKMLNF